MKVRVLMNKKVLIVDDDPVQRRLLTEVVKKAGLESLEAEGGVEALKLCDGPEGNLISLMILDLVMPDLDGMGVLERLRPKKPHLPVIVQTAHGGIDTAVSAMRAGADDFVVKPVSPERLQVSIKNALKVNALTSELTRSRNQSRGFLSFDELIAGSPAMTQALKIGRRAAQSNIPILLEGESGVGKEVFARAIQGSGERSGKPFITVNCGAIPDNLVESILFGHEKGAFTGAAEKHDGKFVEASGGTLFLDEVSELPLDTQVKLLRALQEGEVDPVGAKRPVKVDIRLISATNKDMIQLVTEGKFREDLYYRLNVFPITIPPLSRRADDIPALTELFITRLAAEEGRRIAGVMPDAMEMLQKYEWPGNVRQLENAVFRAIVLCEGDVLTKAEFPQIAAQVDGYVPSPPPAPRSTQRPIYQGPAMIGDGLPAPKGAAAIPSAIIGNGVQILSDSGDVRKLEEVEADIIRHAIGHYQGHMSKVARGLGIGRSTLYRKVKEMGLEAGL